jgi:hypothetical protein
MLAQLQDSLQGQEQEWDQTPEREQHQAQLGAFLS